jgi:hypothetical protein
MLAEVAVHAPYGPEMCPPAHDSWFGEETFADQSPHVGL